MVAPYSVKGGTFLNEKSRVWSQVSVLFGNPGARHFDLAPDGKRFAVVTSRSGSVGSTPVVFLLNFFDELRRLVPVK
jgi:hypothetical protein